MKKNGKKFNVKLFLQKFLPILLVVAVVAVFFTVFIVNNNKRVVQQNSSYVAETTKKTADRIGSELNTASAALMNMASMCDPGENTTYPENLKGVNTGVIFSNIDYVNKDGTIFRYTPPAESGGKGKVDWRYGVNGYEYYKNGVENGKTGVFAQLLKNDLFNQTSDERVLIVYTPVKNKAKTEVVGVIVGRFAESKLRSLMDLTFLGHPSDLYLFSLDLAEEGKTDSDIADAHILLGPDESTSNESLFDNLSPSAGDKLKAELKKMRTGASDGLMADFTSSGSTGLAYLSLVPGSNNVHPWLVIQTFPSQVTAEMTRLVNLEGLQLGLGLIFALVVYICLILIINYVQNKNLVKDNRDKSYVVDAVTQLYDRFTYVNLQEKKYRYIADTAPNQTVLAEEGDYDLFREKIVATFKDGYDKKRLSKKLAAEQIIKDLDVNTSELRYEYRTVDGQNNSKWEDMSIVCLSRNDKGEAVEVVFARQNISSLKEKELQNQVALKEAFSAAEEANKAKSNFLSNMSHDIRTPMNAVLGFSALLEKSADDPEKVLEYTRKIKSSGQHLLGLINDVLDMSKIESGKITLNDSEFEISELLDEINSVIAPQAKAKNQHYTMRAKDLKNETFVGDKLRISQILINVLSNAVKYTADGGNIDFNICVDKQIIPNNNYENLSFIISDNGIGMSEEFLKNVYEPFEREDNSYSNKIQGSGLGMAITKNLIDLMGGTIDVKSKVGEGTTFRINLQLRSVEKIEDGEFWNRYSVRRTLVVDDEEDVCENVSELLKHAGLDVAYCTDGRTAYDMVKKSKAEGKPFDVVLIDLKMPVLDGVETARLLRGELGERASLFILTAYDWDDVEKEAEQAGIDGFMAKPFFVSAFKQVISRIRNRFVEQPESVEKDVLSGMNFLIAEDNEINAEIIEELLGICGATCVIAENGKKVVERFENSGENEFDMILMDIQMPVMDGYEATRAIRACGHAKAKTIPIAAMTANAFADDVQKALASGMNAHIAKPVSLDVLKTTVKRIKLN